MTDEHFVLDLSQTPEPKPMWEKFMGDNHHSIVNHSVGMGGSVSFSRHLGLALSDSLWQDLIYRMQISGLTIYRPNDRRWLIGRGDGYCTINLDKDDLVEDIHYSPRTTVFLKKGWTVREELGHAVINERKDD